MNKLDHSLDSLFFSRFDEIKSWDGSGKPYLNLYAPRSSLTIATKELETKVLFPRIKSCGKCRLQLGMSSSTLPPYQSHWPLFYTGKGLLCFYVWLVEMSMEEIRYHVLFRNDPHAHKLDFQKLFPHLYPWVMSGTSNLLRMYVDVKQTMPIRYNFFEKTLD